MKCPVCSKEIPIERITRSKVPIKYCSERCMKVVSQATRQPAYPGLSSATTGAIGELRVACDLLAKGYDCFRALSAACSCDLVILKKSRFLRLEVRSGEINKDGTLHFRREERDAGRYDHYAVVTREGIFYVPQLPE